MSSILSQQQLTAIAEEFGTPLYVYHAERITEQYKKLRDAFTKTDTKFFYASKALTNINILKHVKSIGTSVDCSSINEAKLALLAGFEPSNILYTSNGIHFSEIAEAKELGIHINIDSLHNLEKFGKAYGHSYPVGIRLRPNIMAGGNLKISTGHDKSKFGIPVDQLNEILAVVKQHNIFIRNLHIHTGSEIKDVDVFVKGIEVLFDIIPHFKELDSIDLGGGFKVPYKKGDHETDISLLAKKVNEAFANHPNPGGKHLQVWFEPMFYDSYHHIENISNPSGAEKIYQVVGNICETDTFATDRTLNEVREGDLLVFYNAGAYGFEMSSNFNSRFKPAEVLVKDGKATLIRRRDEFDDLLKNQVI